MVGVPKKAQKGPVKQRYHFLFTARSKMLGFLKNLKWKFSFHVNSFLQNFLATFEQLHGKIMLKQNSPQNKPIFEFSHM